MTAEEIEFALTLTQPWAGLVATGIKLLENRPRPMAPKALFGKRFGIHASRVFDERVILKLAEIAPDVKPPVRCEIQSSVLSVARLVDVLDVRDCRTEGARTAKVIGWLTDHEVDLAQVRFAFGPVIYLLSDVTQLGVTVPARGFQGFWRMAPDVRARVTDQLRAAA